MKLSIIIVSYNTKDKLEMALRSVFDSDFKKEFEVLLVDNNSDDGSAGMVRDKFPQVNLIENQKNLGYSRANNQAIENALGTFILLLNSDVQLMTDSLEKMISFMENHPEAGIAGPRVEKPDGSLDLACRRSFPNPVNSVFRLTGLSFIFPKSNFSSYNLTYLPEDEVLEVDSVMGAFLLIRAEIVKKIGLLDEDYFMYGEDLDWCMRAKQAGYRVFYAPVTKVIHHKGSSSKKSSGKALYEFHRAMSIFYDKYYRQKYNFLISLIVKAGIWTRYALKYIQNFFRQEKYVSK